jgi:hypothetical protein
VGDSRPSYPGARGRGRFDFRLRVRTNLHGLVFVMSGFAVLYAVHRIADLVPVVPYQPTYHAAEFVIDRVEDAAVSEGAPVWWASGHVEPGGATIREPILRWLDGTLVLANDPAVPAVTGQRMHVWFSVEDDAPLVSLAQMRCIPDSRMVGFWIVFAIGALAVGLRLTIRAGHHLQREYFAERVG